MKQQADNKTIDAFSGSAKRGRPAKYASAAEKQRAYRQRTKAEKTSSEGLQQCAIEYAINQMQDAPGWVIEGLQSLRKKPRRSSSAIMRESREEAAKEITAPATKRKTARELMNEAKEAGEQWTKELEEFEEQVKALGKEIDDYDKNKKRVTKKKSRYEDFKVTQNGINKSIDLLKALGT